MAVWTDDDDGVEWGKYSEISEKHNNNIKLSNPWRIVIFTREDTIGSNVVGSQCGPGDVRQVRDDAEKAQGKVNGAAVEATAAARLEHEKQFDFQGPPNYEHQSHEHQYNQCTKGHSGGQWQQSGAHVAGYNDNAKDAVSGASFDAEGEDLSRDWMSNGADE